MLGCKTPKEDFSGKKPNIRHFRISGCLVYCYVPKEKRTKLDPIVEKGKFVRHNKTSKAYRIYILTLRKIMVRMDVKFEEEKSFRKSHDMAVTEYQELEAPKDEDTQVMGTSGFR